MKNVVLFLTLVLALSACSPRESAPPEPAAPESPTVEAPSEAVPTAEAKAPELPMTKEEAFQAIGGLRQLRLYAPWDSCQELSVGNFILWFGYGVQERGELERYMKEDWPCARFPAQELEEAVCAAFDVTAEQLRADRELFVEAGEDSYYLLPEALAPYSGATSELRAMGFEGEALCLRFTLYSPDYMNPQQVQPLRLLLEQDDSGAWRYKALLEDTED